MRFFRNSKKRKKWIGVIPYLVKIGVLPKRPDAYEISWDEGNNTYWWFKDRWNQRRGYKHYFMCEISLFLNHWFGW